MKRLLSFFANTVILLIPVLVVAQHTSDHFDMTVTYIRGKATREKGNQVLQEGNKINSGEKIKFSSDKDFLIAIHPQNGRIKIAVGEPGSSTKGNEVFEMVAKMIRQNWETPTLGYRSGEFALLEDELATDININPKLLVMQSNKYLYPRNKYAIDDKHFFFLQLQVNGKTENEQLSISDDTVLINRSSFSNLLSRAGTKEGTFYMGYFDAQQNKATTIREISPYVDVKNESVNMVGAIINALKTSKTKSEIFNECYTQVYYFLGKPSAISLTNTIDHFY